MGPSGERITRTTKQPRPRPVSTGKKKKPALPTVTSSPRKQTMSQKYTTEQTKALKQARDPVRDMPYTPEINDLRKYIEESVALSKSKQTQAGHQTAINTAKEVSLAIGENIEPPFTQSKIALFVAYLQKNRDIQASTIRAYIDGLNFWHSIEGYPRIELITPLIKLMLSGHKHKVKAKSDAGERPKSKRRAITFQLLAYFREKVLSVATVAFYGSFRLGELLSKKATSFDPSTSLTIQDIQYIKAGSKPEVSKDMFMVKVKSPKVTRVGGSDNIPLFSFKHDPEKFQYDPVTERKTYLKMLANHGTDKKTGKKGMLDGNLPVFRLSSGNCLRKSRMNKLLKEIFAPLLLPGEYILGHSFRAGLVSHMKGWGFSEQEIMGQGRWKSEAWRVYCSLPPQTNFILAQRIANRCSSVLLEQTQSV